jgi:hypothetical protein
VIREVRGIVLRKQRKLGRSVTVILVVIIGV